MQTTRPDLAAVELREALDAHASAAQRRATKEAAYVAAREAWFAAGTSFRKSEAELIKLIKAHGGAVQDGDTTWTVDAQGRLKQARNAYVIPPPSLELISAR